MSSLCARHVVCGQTLECLLTPLSKFYTLRNSVAQVSQITPYGQFIMTPAWYPTLELLIIASPANSPDGRFKHGLVAFRITANCSLDLAWNTQLGNNSRGNENYVFSSPTIAGEWTVCIFLPGVVAVISVLKPVLKQHTYSHGERKQHSLLMLHKPP